MGKNSIAVDADGVFFPDPEVPVCDIVVEGNRVMSMKPSEQKLLSGGKTVVPWPPRVKSYLHGLGHIVVREHLTGTVHFDEEIRFDDADARVRIVDQNGRPLTLDKWGGLTHSFADSDFVLELVQDTAELLKDLKDIGVPAFAAYGTLLGAVRAGKVIGHDSDTDVSYLSAYEHPADIARESFAIQRELLNRGWQLTRGRTTKLTVKKKHNIDIFTSYFWQGRFNLDQWVDAPMRRDQIVPLSTVMLEGIELPAPADPEAVLAANYGPGWRVPDPSFDYDRNAPQMDRVRVWFGGVHSHRVAWGRYWAKVADAGPRQPSPFVEWVAKHVERDSMLVDVCCGDGTDTLALAKLGMPAIGYDYCPRAHSTAVAASKTIDPRPQFSMDSLADTRVILTEGARLATIPGRKVVMARFALDVLPPDGYANFWNFLRLVMARGGQAFLEFRTKPKRPFPGSGNMVWRRVVDPVAVRERLAQLGGTIVEEKTHAAQKDSGVTAGVRRLAVSFD